MLDYDGIHDAAGYSGDIALTLPATPVDGLEAQVRLLEDDLRKLINNRPNLNDAVYQDSFATFFTCATFHKLLTLFFRRRQLLARMIHWPTFNPATVDPGLLLAIALCGAAYSHHSVEPFDYAATASKLHQLAEKYIFRRMKRCPASDASPAALEVCQAAYLVVFLQLSGSDYDARRRAITKRHPALVDAIRRLGMLKRTTASPTHNADWHAFVYKESCIKLVTWTLFTDGLLALFFNSPPSMTVSEMSIDLPCSDGLWDADCPSSFEEEENEEKQTLQPLCIKEVMEELLGDDWDDTIAAAYGRLSVFSLYSVIGGGFPGFRPTSISAYKSQLTSAE
ncbi:uncharacterized protein DNG_04274 [Cephalotrichum gorgonifer]|uniref:Xylanolytic transcriptional activator regulatory domain-containing protein n=1 Tax=Cephalotrichum gorgonifer TaxID=2041049 RepID=A0AAE8MYK1_9PEZI|nr:uncharacterized protein DNG_04274 [Cephalotrichum gorgonifer]